MTLHEPMTVFTDYILAVAAAVFAVRLWNVFRAWAVAFAFTAAASFLGGTYHGIAPLLTDDAATALWKATVLSVGLASAFLLAGCGRAFAVVAAVKFVIYAAWIVIDDDFAVVIADYGATLLIVGIVFATRRSRATPWVIGSIAVSVIGALVQQSGMALHRHFNHNDIYHVIQLLALWMLYRGGRLTTSERVRPTSPPT